MQALAKLGSAAALTLGLISAAQSQQFHPFHPDKDSREIDFSATFNFDPIDSQSAFARFGYFFNRHIQIGVEGSYTRFESGSTTQDAWNIGLFGNWHFPTATPWLPYAGLFTGYADASNADGSASWGAQGGAKYFFNPNVAGFAELRWRDLQDSDDQLGLFLGLSIFFR
jgi:hypothetical protein